MPNDDLDRPRSPAELAAQVGVNVHVVRRLIREKRLKHVFISKKMRWVTLRDWNEFISSNTQAPDN